MLESGIMKKILAIVVISFLWTANSLAERLEYICWNPEKSFGNAAKSDINYIIDTKKKYFEINHLWDGTRYVKSTKNGQLSNFKMKGTTITYDLKGTEYKKGVDVRLSFNFAEDTFIDKPIDPSIVNAITVTECRKKNY
tara:strand:- start:19 stop:435 length:417 start_codon:yes stop_codon:yes gene_type:complete